MKNTIKTDERIFEVTNFDGNKYLVNLDAFSIDKAGQLLAYNEEIHSIRHYWNNDFQKISKYDVKIMLK